MINLNQHMVNIEDVNKTYMKLEPFFIDINKEFIKNEIQKYKNELDKAVNSKNRNNLNNIINYLKKIDTKIEAGKIELCWNIEKEVGIANTYPIRMIKEDDYGLNSCDFIEIHDEKIIELEFIDLVNILSYDMAYRDLGDSIEYIEESLESSGIAGYTDASIITDYFKRENLNPYKLSKDLYIEDSPYIMHDKKKIKNYFGTNEHKY